MKMALFIAQSANEHETNLKNNYLQSINYHLCLKTKPF